MPAGIYCPSGGSLVAYIAARSKAAASGCIVWTGSRTKGGYGTCNFNSSLKTTAHRAAYIVAHGSIPAGQEIDHLCKNTLCVNPAHLEVVTRQQNVDRSAVAAKSHCINGHPFDAVNTYVKANGTKSCRLCNNARQRVLRAANPERYRNYDLKRSRA